MKVFVKKDDRSSFFVRMDASEKAGHVALLEDAIDTLERTKATGGRRFTRDMAMLLKFFTEMRHALLHPEEV